MCRSYWVWLSNSKILIATKNNSNSFSAIKNLYNKLLWKLNWLCAENFQVIFQDSKHAENLCHTGTQTKILGSGVFGYDVQGGACEWTNGGKWIWMDRMEFLRSPKSVSNACVNSNEVASFFPFSSFNRFFFSIHLTILSLNKGYGDAG